MGSGGPRSADLGRSVDVGHLLSPQGHLSTLVCSVFLRNQERTVQSPGGYMEWKGGSPRAWEGGVWILWESSTYQTQPELSPPARRCGRTPVPCPVCLSDWLSCQLFHRQMQTCQGGKWGPVGAGETPWGPGRPTASRHFPPRMKQYSLIRLTSSSPWAELGTGAARIHSPGAGGLTVSWDKHTQSQTVVPRDGCSTRAHTKHSVSPEERTINFEEGEVPGQGGQEDSLEAGHDSEHTGGVPPPPWSPIWPLPPSLVSPTQDASLTSSCIALVLS